DLAAYFAKQPITTGAASPELVAAGERLYRGGNAENKIPACSACHGPDGRGNHGAKFPALAGQHAQYTEIALNAYRDNTRKGGNAGHIMHLIAKQLSPEDIKAVASYLEGLH